MIKQFFLFTFLFSLLIAAFMDNNVFSAPTMTLTEETVAKTKKYKIKYEDDDIMLRIVERTPETISAFYQGREFSKPAIDEILNTCYVTVIIKNKTNTTLWLDLNHWKFSRNNQKIKRIKRDYWKKRWDKIKLNPAHRATFGWTLMPEVRDLRADEGVGGSIVIPLQNKPFMMTANFQTKPDKSGSIKTVTMENVKCVTDTNHSSKE